MAELKSNWLGLDSGQSFALVALFSGVASGVALKTIGPIPSGEAIAIRSLLAFGLIAVIVVARRPSADRLIGRRGLARAMLDALAGLTFSLAIFEIPLSLLASIHATLPVISVILSGILLKERLRPGNWIALALACGGTLLILQPGLSFSPLGVSLALVSTLAYAFRDITTRLLPPQTDTFRIALVALAMAGGVAAMLPSEGGWVWPSALDYTLLTLAAIGFVAANVLIIAALRRSELSRIAPLRYSSVLWSLAFDAAIWGYVPGLAGAVGIILILLAGTVQMRTHSTKPHRDTL
ncbi:DMT family transporter [Marinovum sp. 2_MG-2023]|uniref:DMT family transporter n=1 Tax=unclassified Marinovum TaxID=2647166 RepID=UPI0026E1D15F|nr:MULTISPECIES: DMT family transporter [unclassified Marinovum]MDO6732048.1 DMT family transporter [Marinovum sp. 2_MG-2023]MDO6781300.1 DMT family transporter [Marinovum sp. 1_MG-2023]